MTLLHNYFFFCILKYTDNLLEYNLPLVLINAPLNSKLRSEEDKQALATSTQLARRKISYSCMLGHGRVMVGL